MGNFKTQVDNSGEYVSLTKYALSFYLPDSMGAINYGKTAENVNGFIFR
jgi:hypothetical protein